MAEKQIEQILQAIQSLRNSMNDRFDSVESRLSSLESDMKKVLKCVSHENADFEVSHINSTK